MKWLRLEERVEWIGCVEWLWEEWMRESGRALYRCRVERSGMNGKLEYDMNTGGDRIDKKKKNVNLSGGKADYTVIRWNELIKKKCS